MGDESTEVRRARVAEMAAAGVSQRGIARRLGVHHATVQRDLEAGVRPARQRCEECAGPLLDPRAVTCSPECREARRKRHRKARWYSDPDWRAKRTRATAESLVKRHGEAAPGWARALVASEQPEPCGVCGEPMPHAECDMTNSTPFLGLQNHLPPEALTPRHYPGV